MDYEDLLQSDLELMHLVLGWMHARPLLCVLFSRLVSAHPWLDVGALVWVISALGVLEVGREHFWVVALNLAAATTAQRLIRARRPVELDRTLQPSADRSADSFGFPSLESFMSVVVLGHLCLCLGSLLLVLPSLAICLVVGGSRIYAKSRLPHQVVGSWLLGIPGIAVGKYLYVVLHLNRLSVSAHWAAVGGFFVCVLAVFALAAEANESRLVHVKRGEFLRVISHIINSSSSGSGGANPEEGDDQPTQPQMAGSPRSRRAAEMQVRSQRSARRDSFFFLHRSLLQRAGEAVPEETPRSMRPRV